MKLSFFVHDLYYEIGHSNALIEQINNLDFTRISNIYIIVYSCDKLDLLFPKINIPIKIYYVPFKNIKPFLFKEIWYHLYTLILSLLFFRKSVKIGIGTVCLNVNVSNVQFIHNDWKKIYFKNFKFTLLQYIYKRLLYFYFDLIEFCFFYKTKKHVICLSEFVKQYLHRQFDVSNDKLHLVYSSTNTSRFKFNNQEKKEILRELAKTYPEILQLNLSMPIYLFVGAFERKGGDKVIQSLLSLDKAQIIIVGKQSNNQIIKSFKKLKIIHIVQTNRLVEIYSISDCFVFPTLYEPFGLVITEAAIMGLQVITTKKKVGASEILHDLDEIYLVNSPDLLPVHLAKILSVKERQLLICDRKKVFDKYNWRYSGAKLSELCLGLQRK